MTEGTLIVESRSIVVKNCTDRRGGGQGHSASVTRRVHTTTP